MSRPILALRISRRAIGAVMLSGDALAYADTRHLSSHRDRAVAAAPRFLDRLLADTQVDTVVLDAPSAEGSTVAAVLAVIGRTIADRHLRTMFVSKAEVTASFGLAPTPTRAEVRNLVDQYWPDLARLRPAVRLYASDAAAAALLADCRMALSRTSP